MRRVEGWEPKHLMKIALRYAMDGVSRIQVGIPTVDATMTRKSMDDDEKLFDVEE